MELLHKEITEKIIEAFYIVYNEHGYGFLEKVYQNSLLAELTEAGFDCKKHVAINVFYRNKLVGEYYADIIVDNCVILELKAADSLIDEHERQLINYLKATEIEVGLLLNFGKNPEFKRKIFTNDRKKIM